VCVQLAQDHSINTQQAMPTWQPSWRRLRNDEDFGDPLDKATEHRPLAVCKRWFRVFDSGSKARMHVYLHSNGSCLQHGKISSRYPWFTSGRGRMEGGQHISLRIGRVRDAYHLVWWMTNITHCLFAMVLLALVKPYLKLCSSTL
jgi:hypothetical protein